uniref:Tc1-like transposase DDE domain-containing protein n=1 Tax=Myripristis murdjan TaxID=586833 RepID=A0A668ACI7_9TELE
MLVAYPFEVENVCKIPLIFYGLCIYNSREGMEWPALSPDLNPIENLWDQLSRRVEARSSVPQNLNVLRAALQEEWDAMPQQTISRLVNNMRRRCQAVIDADIFCCGISTTVVGFCFKNCLR